MASSTFDVTEEFEKNPEFLPDLNNEKSTDQAVFEMQVYRANQEFKRKMEDIIAWHESDPKCRKYPIYATRNKSKFKHKARKFEVKKGILYKWTKRSDGIERKLEVVTDMKRQDSLIDASHFGLTKNPQSQACSGHFGRDKVYSTLYSRYLFPKMKERVSYIIKTCETCQMNSNKKMEKAGHKLKSIPVPCQAWAQVGIDIIGPLKEDKGMKYLCTCIDYHTKFPEAEALTEKSGKCVGEFVYKLFCRYGVFSICISDQGREFNNELINRLFELSGVEHRVSAPYHPQTCGQIERTNQTIESVLKKTMESSDKWVDLIQSVLFSIRVNIHSSTGFSPFRLLYQKDPIVPFQYSDSLKNTNTDPIQDIIQSSEDPVESVFQFMEEQRKIVFGTASKNIRKAQKQQQKAYNKRNLAPPFAIGQKVLKKNVKDAKRLEKFTKPFMGPYEIIGVSPSGSFYLRDRHSHNLKLPVHPSKLVKFHERNSTKIDNRKKKYTKKKPEEKSESVETNIEQEEDNVGNVSPAKSENVVNSDEDEISSPGGNSSPVISDGVDSDVDSYISTDGNEGLSSHNGSESDGTSSESDVNVMDTSTSSISNDIENIPTCQRSTVYSKTGVSASSPINVPSQIIIMQSHDEPMSSDESFLVEVDSPKNNINIAPETLVSDIPIEIVDDLFDDDNFLERQELYISAHKPPPAVYFVPLTTNDRIRAGKAFKMNITEHKHPLKYTGVGLELKPNITPEISKPSKGDGGCLYHSLSILLTGQSYYSYLLRHTICNYIADASNYEKLREIIPKKYSSGNEYLKGSGMRSMKTWGTDLELVVFSLICGHEVYVFTNQGNWVKYGKNTIDPDNCTSFYLSNESGIHFDPVLDAV